MTFYILGCSAAISRFLTGTLKQSKKRLAPDNLSLFLPWAQAMLAGTRLQESVAKCSQRLSTVRAISATIGPAVCWAPLNIWPLVSAVYMPCCAGEINKDHCLWIPLSSLSALIQGYSSTQDTTGSIWSPDIGSAHRMAPGEWDWAMEFFISWSLLAINLSLFKMGAVAGKVTPRSMFPTETPGDQLDPVPNLRMV